MVVLKDERGHTDCELECPGCGTLYCEVFEEYFSPPLNQ